MRSLTMLLGLGLAAAACGGDDVTGAALDECADYGGAGLECEGRPIETVEDACQKLLDCGAIPLESGGLDWQECLELDGDLDDLNRQAVLACVEVSSCDELLASGSPPLCLQHGN